MSSRRDFIKYLGLMALPVFTGCGGGGGSTSSTSDGTGLSGDSSKSLHHDDGIQAKSLPDRRNVLVSLHLSGGNDFLNTFVSAETYGRYRDIRPLLSLDAEQGQLIELSPGMMMRADMSAGFLEAWQAGELALVHGVGYESQNYSHFSSVDHWHAASSPGEDIGQGWLARLFMDRAAQYERPLIEAIILDGDMGPAKGLDRSTLVSFDPASYLSASDKSFRTLSSSSTAAIDHVARVMAAKEAIFEELSRNARVDDGVQFPDTPLGRQLEQAAHMIRAGVSVDVIKVSQGGFDTHADQLPTQARLWSEISAALSAFRNSLMMSGDWERVIVSSYAEFGRRPFENGTRGTDHGSSSTHFLMGGRVRGGEYGEYPDLYRATDVAFNFQAAIDFRSIYRTMANRWFEVGDNFLDRAGQYEILDFIV